MLIAWNIPQIILYCYIFLSHPATSHYGVMQDQTSPRANTLQDDADDIQKQLENEAKDRLNLGSPKTVWIFHLPTRYPFLIPTEPIFSDHGLYLNKRFFSINTRPVADDVNLKDDTMNNWAYRDQINWSMQFPNCGGRSQSPVNLPIKGLVKAKAREMMFFNYNMLPISLTLRNDGKRVVLIGEWEKHKRPIVYSGAAYSRRYLFHSLAIHWPSEHLISSMQYPIESQVLLISAEYKNLKDAMESSSNDPLAFLGIVNMYKYGHKTHPGMGELLNSSMHMREGTMNLTPKPLSYYSPLFKRYACYQGSLPTPPCTESVLWIIPQKALLVNKDEFNVPYGLNNIFGEPDVKPFRYVNPLNDRPVYLF